MTQKTEKRVVVLGGGTGGFVTLSALKPFVRHLTAIVNMVDDGGSTGELRDQLGILPPGDVRQCLVALSDYAKMRDLFTYRFDEGTLKGHSFGNLFLTALEKQTGSFAEAVMTASNILRVRGKVLPATLDDIRLKMSWPGDEIVLKGERVIDADHFKKDPRKAELSLVPTPVVNPEALKAIDDADVVVIAPGDLYTSLGPLLVIDGIGDALARTKARVVYVCNLVTKQGQTDGFTVVDHVAEIERFAGEPVVDVVIYNSEMPDAATAKRYEAEGAFVVAPGELEGRHFRAVAAALIGDMEEARHAETAVAVTRSLIRHDTVEMATRILDELPEAA